MPTFQPIITRELPKVDIRIGHYEMEATIRTGSARNMIRDGLLPYPVNPQHTTEFLMGGDCPVTSIGTMMLPINIKNKIFMEKFYVIPGLSDKIILGSEMFRNNGCTISFANGTLTFADYPGVVADIKPLCGSPTFYTP